MCHGYVDWQLLMRETETRAKQPSFEPVPEPRPAVLPGLVAALRGLFARPKPVSDPVAETVAAE